MNVDNDELELPKSKSRIKREMLELQELGGKLTLLNRGQLKKLNLTSELFEAVVEYQKIFAHGAKRRQLQYIGRLMREIEDPTFIREYLENIAAQNSRSSARHHHLESWREKLLSDEAGAVTEFILNNPHADRQKLRHLIQKAKKERQTGKPAGACKLLFKYIRDLQSENRINRNEIESE